MGVEITRHAQLRRQGPGNAGKIEQRLRIAAHLRHTRSAFGKTTSRVVGKTDNLSVVAGIDTACAGPGAHHISNSNPVSGVITRSRLANALMP